MIEHNPDVLKTADWIIDLGPEAGEKGGKIMASGTPQDMIKSAAKSHTGRYLKEYVEGLTPKKAKVHDLDR